MIWGRKEELIRFRNICLLGTIWYYIGIAFHSLNSPGSVIIFSCFQLVTIDKETKMWIFQVICPVSAAVKY